MNIGYFTTTFPYNDRFNDKEFFKKYEFGGAQVAAFHLANSMADKGHNVSVYTTSYDSKDEIEKYNNMVIYRYGSKFKIEKRNVPLRLFSEPLNHKLDIIHAHSSIPIAVFAAMICSYKAKIPFVLTYHGDSQEDFGGFFHQKMMSFYNKHVLKNILNRVDNIITPSQYYIEDSKYICDYKDKIKIIPNGVNLKEFNIQYSKEECKKLLNLMGKNVVLFVGNVHASKGMDVLLRAIPRVVEVYPDTLFIIMGEGEICKYKLLSKELGVENNIRFTGYIFEEKPFYYRASDIFVLPSYSEMYPMVLLEASASGIPMIVSNLKSLNCIVKEGYNGTFNTKGDISDLASKIIFLLNDKEMRCEMGRNALRNIMNFTWERVAEETENLYSQLIINNSL